MPAEVQIITVDEARSILHLDGDYPEEELKAIIAEATSFINRKTNNEWDKELTVDPLAKLAVRYKIQELFYHDDEHKFTDTVISLCEDLRDVIRLRRPAS